MERRSFMAMALSAGLATSAGASTPRQNPVTPVPDDVIALIAPTDTVLAYKEADLYGDGTRAAVMVIRHQITGPRTYDPGTNPCDLLVLHQSDDKITIADKNSELVDCNYNDIARNARTLSLNDDLKLEAYNISYVNQRRWGYETFKFSWSAERSAWYLRSAAAAHPDDNAVNAIASYPIDIPWISLSSVDPNAVFEILKKLPSTRR